MLIQDGGFNEGYSHYGFEDKHLVVDIIKARGIASLFLVDDVVAFHDDSNSVSGVVHKFNQSARHSAAVFCKAHMDFYCQLLYSKFDSRVVSIKRKYFLSCAFFCITPFSLVAAKVVSSRFVPFFLKKTLVQLLCAKAYFQGSLVEPL